MTLFDAIDRIGESATRAGFVTSNGYINRTQVLVARTSQFRWRWFATKLHTFLVVCPFSSEVATRGNLDDFLNATMQYVKVNKPGLPVGLQTGVAAIVTAVTEHADASARRWATTPHARQFGVLSFPVLLDIARADAVRPSRIVVGGVYSGYLKAIVDELVADTVGARAVNS